MTSDVLIVIPARYGSSRLKGKVLEDIDGKSVIRRVWEACVASEAGEVVIATESDLVLRHCRAFGAACVLTSDSCQSGTDRVWEVAKDRKETFIINVQGDEPFTQISTITGVANLLKTDPSSDIATACIRRTDENTFNNPNAVKAVLTPDMRALYFSRAGIPFHRDAPASFGWFKHYGIYGYRRAALAKFVSLPPSDNEKAEKLEQLRALDAGMTIKSIIIKEAGPAIDTAQDLEAARQYLKK